MHIEDTLVIGTTWELYIGGRLLCGRCAKHEHFLGVQWLYSIGKYSTNYQTLEMEFLAPDGKRVVLRGMPNEASGSATTKGMTTIFRHEDKTRTRK